MDLICPALKVHTDLFARKWTKKNGVWVLEDFGLLAHCRKFTTAGRDYLIDALQNLTEPENFKYHASGTDNTAENQTDTALGTEVESTRATGSQTENGSGTYRSVGTITYTATRTIVEHGLFSALTVGTLLDRTVFAGIGVVNTDQIEFTFDLTIAAEA